MPHVTLYRKYRSQTFAELAGQDHVTQTLRNAIAGGRPAHAYLFCGPRGTGKTTTARLLAKALNCERGPSADPCNECDICRRVSEGTCLDVREIDAASNRGIEEIRKLREDVAYAPTECRYKVYVIDEAHQITGDAFNAFLKTLEEPPPYVVFVLATTEAHRIPATISSRCQKFDYRPASLEQLRERLRQVAAAEGATVEPAAIDLMAREANGSWRDALSVLEQVLAYAGDEVSAEAVYQVLGIVETEALYQIAEQALTADGAGLFATIQALLDGGKDARQLVHDLTEHYRTLMLTAAGSQPLLEPEWRERVAAQAKAYGGRRLVGSIEVLAQAEREARWSEQPRLLLELAAFRLMQGMPERPAAEPRPRPRATQASEAPAPVEPAAAAPAAAPRSEPATRAPEPDALQLAPPPAPEAPAAESAPLEIDAPPAQYSADAPAVERVRNRWRVIGQELKRLRLAPLEGLLRDAMPETLEGETLLVRFPSEMIREVFERRKPAEKQQLADLIEQLAGVKCAIRAVGPGEGAPAADGRKGGASPTTEAPPAPRAPAPSPSGEQTRLVHDVVDLFQGELLTDAEG